MRSPPSHEKQTTGSQAEQMLRDGDRAEIAEEAQKKKKKAGIDEVASFVDEIAAGKFL
jgi:hypothetical protein